ncbi:MAG: YjjG family noncanonical pyrimidine nucleotidase [Flavobacteriaceae bacterium]|nr:YjjG family noncanonical pyrimidine nucleotidase [Flavobacteriaceae bacterium]
MNIKHIFFDLDHTLWDFETNSNKTFEYIFQKNKVCIEINDFIKIYKPINEKYWKLYREDKVTKIELRYSRLKETFDHLQYSIDNETIHLLSEKYIEFLPKYNALLDGTIELLEYLKPKYEMHIITNGFEEVQYKKMKNSFILPYFNHVISSERVGVKKPNPKIFHFALKISGAKPEESMMIGDNFEADILGAKNIGMYTVFCQFNKKNTSKEGLTISKLSQIKQYL